MNAEKKKQTLINLATELSTCRENIIACGDGANDIPMLLHAGNGVAWKAKPKTREKVANQINFNGFESLLFFIEEKLYWGCWRFLEMNWKKFVYRNYYFY